MVVAWIEQLINRPASNNASLSPPSIPGQPDSQLVDGSHGQAQWLTFRLDRV